MRDLYKVFVDCKNKLDALDIPYGKVAEITINRRAKKRWGQCRLIDGKYYINISEVLLREENSIRGLEETIIHELIHTCEGCMNHGPVWKAYVEIVNKAFGYNIKRTNSAYEKGIAGAEKPVTYTTNRPKKRNRTLYSVSAIEDFIRDTLIPNGYEILTQVGMFVDSYICVAPSERYYNYVLRANDSITDGYYTISRRKKISAALQAEINAVYDEMYGEWNAS